MNTVDGSRPTSNQYAYDASSRRFSAGTDTDTDTEFTLLGVNDGAQVNHGITTTAVVPFRIPVGDKLVKLVLHDSAFSGEATIGI